MINNNNYILICVLYNFSNSSPFRMGEKVGICKLTEHKTVRQRCRHTYVRNWISLMIFFGSGSDIGFQNITVPVDTGINRFLKTNNSKYNNISNCLLGILLCQAVRHQNKICLSIIVCRFFIKLVGKPPCFCSINR